MGKKILIIICVIGVIAFLFRDKLMGSNPEKDLEKAKQLYTKACEISHHRWQEHSKALKMLEKSAQYGYVDAESELGHYLTYSDDCNKEGIKWLKKAAENGDFRSSIKLAWVYLSEKKACDEYYEDDAEEKGMYYLLKAAEKSKSGARAAKDNAIKLGVESEFSQAYSNLQ